MSVNHDIRSRQLNPCDHLFWKCRGYPERPVNWQDILEDMGYYDNDKDENEESEYEDEESEYEDEESEYEDEESEYDSEYEEHCESSNANNPNNDAYWRRLGYACRPDDWRERI